MFKNISVTGGAPTRGIEAAPLINYSMSKSFNSAFSKQKLWMIYILVLPSHFYVTLPFVEKMVISWVLTEKAIGA